MSHKANDIYREQLMEWGQERDLIDDLTYVSYCHNRETSPDISPERWLKVFPKALEFERRRNDVRGV